MICIIWYSVAFMQHSNLQTAAIAVVSLIRGLYSAPRICPDRSSRPPAPVTVPGTTRDRLLFQLVTRSGCHVKEPCMTTRRRFFYFAVARGKNWMTTAAELLWQIKKTVAFIYQLLLPGRATDFHNTNTEQSSWEMIIFGITILTSNILYTRNDYFLAKILNK